MACMATEQRSPFGVRKLLMWFELYGFITEMVYIEER